MSINSSVEMKSTQPTLGFHQSTVRHVCVALSCEYPTSSGINVSEVLREGSNATTSKHDYLVSNGKGCVNPPESCALTESSNAMSAVRSLVRASQ
jgi:hypothetical protein